MDSSNLYLDGQDDESRLIYTIGFLWGKINSQIDEVLARVDLNIAKFNILMIVKHIGKDNGVQQNEISSQLLVTASNITKMLDKLENNGLITRNDKKGDRRVKIIKITSKGSKLLDEIWADYSDIVQKIAPKMSQDKKKELLKKLSSWSDYISDCNNN